MELILLGVCAFILIFNLFVSFLRGTRKSLLRLGTVVAAAVAAFFMARGIAGKFGTEIALWMEATLGTSESFAPLFRGAASASDAIAVFVKMIFAPLLFLILYGVLKGVLILVYWALANATRPEYRDTAKSHLIGLPIGLVIALVGIFVFISPVFGYLNVTCDAIVKMDRGTGNEGVAELAAYNKDFIEPAKATPVLSSLYQMLGVKIFDGLTVGKWQEDKVYLRYEADVLADIVGNVQVLGGKQIEQYGEAECAAVDALAGDITKSHILSVLCSGTLSTASNHWLEGKSFMGIAPPDVGASGNALLHAFFTVFSTSTQENVGEDLDFFSDVFALAVKYELPAKLRDANDDTLATLMTQSAFLSDTQALLATHPRMAPVGVALLDVGMRSVLKAMGLPDDVKASHGVLLGDIATALKSTPAAADGGIDEVALQASLTATFATHNITVSAATTQLVAQAVAEHFTAGELAALTSEQTVDKLAERFQVVDLAGLAGAQ